MESRTAPDPAFVPPSTARMWGAMAPTAAFVGVNFLAGVTVAAAAATTLAVGVIALRMYRSERIGWVLPISLAYVLVRGSISALTRSEDVYFGIGIAVSAGFALVALASAFTPRPFGLYVMPLAVRYDDEVRAHDRYRSVAAHVTIVWAIAELSVTAWEAWHLRSVGPAEFVGRRTLIGWPFMAFVLFWLIFYTRFRLDPLARTIRRHRGPSPTTSRE